MELRICDVCTRLEDAVCIAALHACIIRRLSRQDRDGTLAPEPMTEIVAEDRWIAQRYGVPAFFGDRDSGIGRVDIDDYASERVEELAADARALGCETKVRHRPLAGGRLPGPGRDQAPPQHREMASVPLGSHHRHLLPRCDVIARTQVDGRSDQPEKRMHLLPGKPLRETPAHAARVAAGSTRGQRVLVALPCHRRGTCALSTTDDDLRPVPKHELRFEDGRAAQRLALAAPARPRRSQRATAGRRRSRPAPGALREPVRLETSAAGPRNAPVGRGSWRGNEAPAAILASTSEEAICVDARDRVCGFRPLPVPIAAGPGTFVTSEHLCWASELPAHPGIRRRIAPTPTVRAASAMGCTPGLGIGPGRNAQRVDIMRWMLRCKREANEAAIDAVLAATGHRPIVEVSARGPWWSAGAAAGRCEGNNVLGRLWIEPRRRHRCSRGRPQRAADRFFAATVATVPACCPEPARAWPAPGPGEAGRPEGVRAVSPHSGARR